MIKPLAALFSVRSASRIGLLVGLLVGLALGEGAALFLLLGALNVFNGADSQHAGAAGFLATSVGLPAVLATFLVSAGLITLLQYITRRETAAIQLDFLHQCRMDLFNAIRRANWLALAEKPASSLRYAFNELPHAISYALDLALQSVVAVALLAIGFVFALYVDAKITTFMLAAGLIAALPFRMAERRAARMSADEGIRNAELHQRVDQSLADIKFLKFLGSKDNAANRVERDSREQITVNRPGIAGDPNS